MHGVRHQSQATNLALPTMRLLETILGELIVDECLVDLLTGGHHEGSVLDNWLLERLSCGLKKGGQSLQPSN